MENTRANEKAAEQQNQPSDTGSRLLDEVTNDAIRVFNERRYTMYIAPSENDQNRNSSFLKVDGDKDGYLSKGELQLSIDHNIGNSLHNRFIKDNFDDLIIAGRGFREAHRDSVSETDVITTSFLTSSEFRKRFEGSTLQSGQHFIDQSITEGAVLGGIAGSLVGVAARRLPGRYGALACFGLMASGAVVGGLYGDRKAKEELHSFIDQKFQAVDRILERLKE